ncbi:hypothetical protein RND71_021756 [Anisodus tanguticus]|uniref:Uncharacterized protein n=1 Tax=Anisodus tanguticus TaxID=243964 RepID=A0AAE1V8I7_9SOLA|nr:hypothetical protein RND71_021756 [Anisodus tanguticus]
MNSSLRCFRLIIVTPHSILHFAKQIHFASLITNIQSCRKKKRNTALQVFLFFLLYMTAKDKNDKLHQVNRKAARYAR